MAASAMVLTRFHLPVIGQLLFGLIFVISAILLTCKFLNWMGKRLKKFRAEKCQSVEVLQPRKAAQPPPLPSSIPPPLPLAKNQ